MTYPCEDSAYRARYRQRQRRFGNLRIGPWEARFDAREMKILFEGREVGVRIYRAEIKTPDGGSGKTARYLIGLCARKVLVRCADLHDLAPFDPAKFKDIFEWGRAQRREICASPPPHTGTPFRGVEMPSEDGGRELEAGSKENV